MINYIQNSTVTPAFVSALAPWQSALFFVGIVLGALIVIGSAILIALVVTLKRKEKKTRETLKEFNAAVCAERAHIMLYSQFDTKLVYLIPIMHDVFFIEKENKKSSQEIEKLNSEKSELKAESAKLKAQYLAFSQDEASEHLDELLSKKNARLVELETSVAQIIKEKSEKSIKLSNLKKKAHDYIDEEEISLCEVIEVEDEVIVNISFDLNRAEAEAAIKMAQNKLEVAQERYAILMRESEQKLASSVKTSSSESKTIEQEILSLEQNIQALSSELLSAEEGKKVYIINSIASIRKQIERLQFKKSEVTDSEQNVVVKVKEALETELDKAAKDISDAQAELEIASNEYARIQSVNDVSEYRESFFVSGSGTISRERKRLEELAEQKRLEQIGETERLAAQAAQAEAQRRQEELSQKELLMQEEFERKAKELEEEKNALLLKAQVASEEEKIRLQEQARLVQEEARRLEAEKLLENQLAAQLVGQEEQRRQEAMRELELKNLAARLEIEQLEKSKNQNPDASRKTLTEEQLAKKIASRRDEISSLRRDIPHISSIKEGEALAEKFNAIRYKLDNEEVAAREIIELIERSVGDSLNAGRIADAEARAAAPRRVVRKVTERVNRIPYPPPRYPRRPLPPPRPGYYGPPRPIARPQGATYPPRPRPYGPPPRPPYAGGYDEIPRTRPYDDYPRTRPVRAYDEQPPPRPRPPYGNRYEQRSPVPPPTRERARKYEE